MATEKPRTSRLPYWKRRVSAIFTLDGFAVAPYWVQQLIVLVAAIAIIALFSPLIGSFKESYQIFMQTAGLEILEGWPILFGAMNLVIGIMISSFIISLLSSALNQFIEKIKQGTLGFYRSNHLVIVNFNEMLVDVLSEINDRGESSGKVYEVVILVRDSDRVALTRQQLLGRTFQNIEIFIRQGSVYTLETYQRINLCGAVGVLLLQEASYPDDFSRDNDILKTLFVLSGWTDFKSTLRRRHEAINPFKFVAEVSGTTGCKEIIAQLATIGGNPSFVAVDPRDIADRLLSRSIVDVAYYSIFQQIFSFTGHEIYFIDPQSVGVDVAGRVFRDICFGFTRGVVIGRSRFRDGKFHPQVSPMDEILEPGDWLIVLAEDERQLEFDFSKRLVRAAERIPQPKEIVNRRICMLGTQHAFPSLMAFLDEPSRQFYRENIISFTDPDEYLQTELIMRIKEGRFDTVVINLDDELAFRVTAAMLSKFPEDDPFLETIVTVIESPATDEILNSDQKNKKTILSQKLCAKYLTQILFQKTLSRVIEDLCSPEGYEINLMEIGRDFPKEHLQSKDRVKQLLLGSDIIYAGVINDDKTVVFDCNDFSKAKTLIVLAKGEM